MTRWLSDIWCCDSALNLPDTWHAITWYLIPGIWCRHLILDMLSLDTWHLISDTWYLTCYLLIYLTPDIWQLMIDRLSLDTWPMLSLGTDTLDLMLWHLSRYYYTWHLYYIVYSWLSLLQRLDMIIILLSDIWYSWTPVFLNPCNRETLNIILLIPYSCWSP